MRVEGNVLEIVFVVLRIFSQSRFFHSSRKVFICVLCGTTLCGDTCCYAVRYHSRMKECGRGLNNETSVPWNIHTLRQAGFKSALCVAVQVRCTVRVQGSADQIVVVPMQHAVICGMGLGMFLNLATSSIMLVTGETGRTREARWGSLHVDEYGKPELPVESGASGMA